MVTCGFSLPKVLLNIWIKGVLSERVFFSVCHPTRKLFKMVEVTLNSGFLLGLIEMINMFGP